MATIPRAPVVWLHHRTLRRHRRIGHCSDNTDPEIPFPFYGHLRTGEKRVADHHGVNSISDWCELKGLYEVMAAPLLSVGWVWYCSSALLKWIGLTSSHVFLISRNLSNLLAACYWMIQITSHDRWPEFSICYAQFNKLHIKKAQMYRNPFKTMTLAVIEQGFSWLLWLKVWLIS